MKTRWQWQSWKGVHKGEKISECQHSQISRGGAKSYRVCRLGLWSMMSALETNTGFVSFPLFSVLTFSATSALKHFFRPVRDEATQQYIYLGFLLNFSPAVRLQCSLIYRTGYSYFSYYAPRVQNVPHSCFEASKEHSCISTVSVLPATVYVASGVCGAK